MVLTLIFVRDGKDTQRKKEQKIKAEIVTPRDERRRKKRSRKGHCDRQKKKKMDRRMSKKSREAVTVRNERRMKNGEKK